MAEIFRKTGRSASILAAITILMAMAPSEAFAGDNTLGGVVHNLGSDIAHPFMLSLVCIAYLLGFWLTLTGLMKLKDSADSRGENAVGEGILRLAGGAFLVALPDAIGTGLYTFYKSVAGYHADINGSYGGANVTDCLSGSDGGITCVIKNLATNLAPIFVEVCFVLMYIIGVAMVLMAVYGLAVSQAHRGPGNHKKIATNFVIGVLLCNVPMFIQTMQTTLGFKSGEILANGGAQGMHGSMSAPPSLLAYTADSSGGVLAEYQSFISWSFVVLVMFGVASVWRGIMQLKSYSEGSDQKGMGSGMTHIIGGVFLCNMKASVCLVSMTFFGTSLGFCT